MLQLSKYPPIPPEHPWFGVEQQRLAGIDLWREQRWNAANQQFLGVIRGMPEFPFVWATYHRFLHEGNGRDGLPKDSRVAIGASPLTAPFSMYRFFERCQVASRIAAYGWNGFETPCPLVLAKWIKFAGGTFIDVGANSGYYSLLALSAGASKAIAFEPFAPAVDVLRCNVEINEWTDRVDIRPLAIADRQSVVQLFLPLQSHGLLETSASNDPTFRAKHSFSFDADATTLDSLLAELPASEALAVKVDVEGIGPTLAVLKGASRLAREKRPVMLVEYIEGPVDGLHQFLNDFSYTSFVCKPNGTGFVETQISPQRDQLNHFFIPNEKMPAFLKAICE